MKKKITLSYFFVLVWLFLQPLGMHAQEYRSIDGIGNNKLNPTWGSVGAPVLNKTIAFTDNISSPSGQDRPNPRFVSNLLFHQNNLANDSRGLSAYVWAWGQFIDHDITLSPDNIDESMDIAVPIGDLYFDPTGSGSIVIPMFRSDYDSSSGTGVDNPRRYLNHITAFIDASTVYGSDQNRANWLRTFEGGKMKVSEGDLLPFNTSTGEYEAPIDQEAPEMAMPIPSVTKWFVAGDVRANENPFLTSIHTLFVREHNRLCEELAQDFPFWTDEQLYQHARKLVGGILQAIVFEEWLSVIGVELPVYNNYDTLYNPGIMNVFNTAAYRYGHTTINSLFVRMDNEGNEIPQGDIMLRDAFFNPSCVYEIDGIEPYLVGMATVIEQDFDCKVIDDLRNFLFGQPGSGGLDLVAININRGRDRGLPDYNTVRNDFNLSLATDFSDLTSDQLMMESLSFVYGDINKIDPWVGMLSEDQMSDALFGPTAMTIIEEQFLALRDGDRFYYQNDSWISQEEKEWIKQTKLADVIRRNTPASKVQDEIFMAAPFNTSLFEIEEEDAVHLQLYPNPVHSIMSLRIETRQQRDAKLLITNELGQVVLERTLNLWPGNNVVSITLPIGFSPGWYVTSIISDGKATSKRFIKI